MDSAESFGATAGPSSGSKIKKLIGRKCVICGDYQSKCPTRKYHKFPPNPQLSKKWALAVGKKWVLSATIIERISRYRICEKHFSDEDYISTTKHRLKPDVVPRGSVAAPKLEILQLKDRFRNLLKKEDRTEDQSSFSCTREVPSSSTHSTKELTLPSHSTIEETTSHSRSTIKELSSHSHFTIQETFSPSHSTIEEPSSPTYSTSQEPFSPIPSSSFANEDELTTEVIVAELIIPKARSKYKGSKCVFCGIHQSESPTRKFHRFPANPKLSEKWALACGKKWVLSASVKDRYARYRVCEKHFSDENYTSKLKNRLGTYAVPQGDADAPKLQLSQLKDRLMESMKKEDGIEDNLISVSSAMEVPSLPTSSSTISDQIPSSNSTEIETEFIPPESWNIRHLIHNPFCLRKFFMQHPDQCHVQNILETIKGWVTPVMYDFIARQLKDESISKYRWRWSVGDRNLALALYLASREAYKSLSRIFYMPSKSKLLEWLSETKMVPGFSAAALSSMKLVTCKVKPYDKLCIVSFAKIKLEPNLSYNNKEDILVGFENFGSYTVSNPSLATHALVFIVRGLCKKWKHVFGYFFSCKSMASNILKRLLNGALSKLVGCGLVPIAIVCDQEESNKQLYEKDLGISIEKPYIYFQNHKIYCLSDVHNLINCLRNSFKHYPATFTHKGIHMTAVWENIVKVWEFDSRLKYRRFDRLTQRNMESERWGPRTLHLAAQVFNEPMGGYMCHLNSARILPSSAIGTAHFCVKLGNLLASVSGRMFKSSRDQPLLAAVSKSSKHLDSWKEFMEFIESIQFQTEGVTSGDINFPFLQGWLLNLSAYRQMIPELLNTIPHVIMCRFTLDIFKSVFSFVRCRSGHIGHPTLTDFQCHIKTLISHQIINTFGNANRKPDRNTILVDVEGLADSEAPKEEPLLKDEESLCQDFDSGRLEDVIQDNVDIFQNDTHLMNSAPFIASYIAKIVYKKYQCETCKACLTSEKELSQGTLFLYFKEFDFVKENLLEPSHSLLLTIYEFGKKFPSLFDKYCTTQGVSFHISNCLSVLNHEWLLCAYHENVWKFIVNFYSRLMLSYKVKFLSQSFHNLKRSKKKVRKLF